MRFLTPPEIARLADAIRPSSRALVLVGADSGLRRSRVDLLRARSRSPRSSPKWVAGCAWGHPRPAPVAAPSGSPAPWSEELAAHLATPAPPDAFVFTAPTGGPLPVIAFRARTWRPATKNAGLGGLRIHDLRHTAVALWIAAGANPNEVAARAGHTLVSFTLDRYGHLYPESDTTLRDRLDAIYSTGERDQGAAVVELFRERSRPSRAPQRKERRWILDRRPSLRRCVHPESLSPLCPSCLRNDPGTGNR
jgi:hypothetical protein